MLKVSDRGLSPVSGRELMHLSPEADVRVNTGMLSSYIGVIGII